MSRADAEKETRNQLGQFIPNESVNAFFEEIKQELEHSTTLVSRLVSIREDHRARGWYLPNPDGPVWSQLRESMQNSGLKSAVDSIDEASDSVVAAMAEPNQQGDKRQGLVIGNVQSGKTANYAAVIAKAVDANYKLIIVLAGIHNNLRSQTQTRIDRDLSVENSPPAWHRLTTAADDFGTAEATNADATAQKSDAIIAVVKKNKGRLENLLAFLKKISTKTRETNLPILIIDDESDQATPDASSKLGGKTTTINKLVRQIWAQVKNGTYIGYTATPFANVFMSTEESPDGHGENLYPKDFIFAMPTPDNYFGAEQLFGSAAVDPEDSDIIGPDVIRSIPEDDRIQLVPKNNSEAEDFNPTMTKSLSDAIKWFIVASAVRRLRGQKRSHSSMLVHTTHRVRPHFQTRKIIDRFLEPLKTDALDGDVSAFKPVFMHEINRASDLDRGQNDAVSWSDVELEIPNVLRKLKTKVDNGLAEKHDRLSYPDDDPQTVIVVGGGTLSRGLTLEGLFVSYFTRSSNTYDTLLQMGRWFGYRPGYEDLQRIWISDGLDDDYRHLALVETELRSEVEKLIKSGEAPEKITVRVREHPGRLQVTSAAKMKHAQPVSTNFEGYRIQTYVFDLHDPAVLEKNLERTKTLIRLISAKSKKSDSGQSSQLFTGVDFALVRDFLLNFKTEAEKDELLSKAIQWTNEKLPQMPWNVVVASGDGPGTTFEDTGFPVTAVNRAPVKQTDPRFPDHINIRTLMTGNDFALDLTLRGYSPERANEGAESTKAASLETLRQARRSEEWGRGSGLLVIYPISRNSVPKTVKTLRHPMADALEHINPELRAEDGDESKPIIGIAVVLPSDFYGVMDDESKATYVGVIHSHIYDDVEETDEVETDTEGDFSS